MPSQEKKEKVNQIKKWFDKTDSLFVLHYKGLKVSEANELRGMLEDYNVELRVLKNTLTRIALSESPRSDLVSLIDGPIAVVFVHDDPAAVAKAVKDFSRGRAELYFQGGILEGTVLSSGQVDTLATLPPRPVLISSVLGQTAAPLSGMMRAMSEPIRKLVGIFAALSERKEEEGGKASVVEPEVSEEPAAEPKEEDEKPEEAAPEESADVVSEETEEVTATDETETAIEGSQEAEEETGKSDEENAESDEDEIHTDETESTAD